ncbi:MAG: transglycosylase domain-containing protein [Bacteroidetes bacterium]|nr:transglycosylase domain-containing protein [Bacteroidota bacterium]
MLTESLRKRYTRIFWVVSLFPFMFVLGLLVLQSEDDLPPISMLDNPPELQASLILGEEGDTLGRYWMVNRTSAEFKNISPFVFDALISTEDERFKEHSGVDFKSIVRSFGSLGRAGGASTISQQLAKLLFTLQQRQREEIARANGETLLSQRGGLIGKFRRLNEKARENIIATRLESRYTKEEIITMYLNQFDFLYNAVGIENAAKVYFNKRPKHLKKEEAAMLVGMCKNPALYNPYTYQIKNYRKLISRRLGIAPENVRYVDMQEAKTKDSLRSVNRRNQVLYQWLRNSEKGNASLSYKLTREEYDHLIKVPVTINYQSVDHKEGMAPYFREVLRQEITDILLKKKEDGTLKYVREDGQAYDIYRDGLKIYTTLNTRLQKAAELAVEKHIKEYLQPAFNNNNRGLKNYPFSNQISSEVVQTLMNSARKNSGRYKTLINAGMSEQEAVASFDTPTQMRVFSWKGEIDTVMSPNDSIRYYKAFLHAGLVSIEPQTGFVRAWVGGVNFKHFSYDHVRQGTRQVGSTIKPFVYAAALSLNVVNPCTTFSPGEYCVDLVDNNNNVVGRYCPRGEVARNVKMGIALSSNPTTVAVMARMGKFNSANKSGGPFEIEKLLRKVEITLNPNDVVPSMCLGSMDLSLIKLVGAQCIFANNGEYNRPTTIERIEDRNGKIIYESTPYTDEALNATVAYEILKMMKGVINQGTGGSLRSGKYGPIPPTAGKTGTTQNNSDGWFVGITPDLVTGVWVGAEDRTVRFKSMAFGQGARMALPIYGYYMQQAYKDPILSLSTRDFDEPPNYDPKAYDCSDAPNPEAADETDVLF